MALFDQFIRTYEADGGAVFVHTAMLRHQGVVVAFAQDSNRRIWYTILDLEGEKPNVEESRKELDVNYWRPNLKEVPWPNELSQVGFLAGGLHTIPEVRPVSSKEEDLQSAAWKSSTGILSELAPFKVVSDNHNIVLFRQALPGDAKEVPTANDAPIVNKTLLVDRFVLAGGDLRRKLETRFQRSRKKYIPSSDKDSLDYRDMEGRPFYEPTQELSMIRDMKDGWFTVLLTPTALPGTKRWQIFSYNNALDMLDSFSIEQAKDGMFNTRGTQYYTSPLPDYQNDVFQDTPGKDPFSGLDLIPVSQKMGFGEYAVSFDGIDQYVRMNENPFLHTNGSTFTISVWLKPADVSTANQMIAGGCDDPSSPTLFMPSILTTGDTSLKFIYYADTGQKKEFTAPNCLGAVDEWVNLVWVKDGVVCHIYSNGVLVHTEAAGYESFNRGDDLNFALGRHTAFYHGEMEELRLWNRPLSYNEIRYHNEYRLVGNEIGLVGYWRMDEGHGEYLNDQTNNGNRGRLLSGQATTTIMRFDGVDDYVVLPLPADEPSTEFTIAFWLNPLDLKTSSTIVFTWGGLAPIGRLDHILQESPYLNLTTYEGTPRPTRLTTNGADQWVHIAYSIRQSSETRLYKDGVRIENADAILMLFFPTALELGKKNGGYSFELSHFNGYITELSMWSVRLSDAQVAALYQGEITDYTDPNLVAYHKFHGNSCENLADSTLHPTLYGSPEWEETNEQPPWIGMSADAMTSPSRWQPSTAPIKEREGIRRSSFRFDDLVFTTGPDALVYYQQETAKTGYEREEKPVKRSGRVMLAVGVRHTDGDVTAVLDLGLAPDGKAALLPDSLQLGLLEDPGGTEPINDLIDRKSQVEQDIQVIEGEIKDLNYQIADVDAALWRLRQDLESLPSQYLKRDNLTTQHDKYTKTLYATFYEGAHESGASKRVAVGSQLSTNTTTYKSFTYDEGVKVTVYEQSSYTGAFARFWHRHKEPWNRSISSYIVEYDDNWKATQTNLQTQIGVVSAEIARIENLGPQLIVKQNERASLNRQLNQKQHELIRLQVELNGIEIPLLGEVGLPMSIVHCDSAGLPVYGSLLKFAPAAGTPDLFDSANGKIGLYFRDRNSDLFAAYYDTSTARVKYLLPTKEGATVALLARHAGREGGETQITVTDGFDSSRCNLSLSNTTLGLSEEWPDLPRDVSAFNRILNGQAFHFPASDQVEVKAPPVDYYDYSAVDGGSPEADLSNGSRLVYVIASHLKHELANVDSGSIEVNEVTSCKWVAQGQGNSLAFDGSNDFLRAPASLDPGEFAPETDLSVEAWVKPLSNQIQTSQALLSYRTNEHHYGIFLDNAQAGFFRVSAGIQGKAAQTTASFPFDEWTHVAAVYNQSHALSFDGQRDFLECGNDRSLDLDGDLTIEAFIALNAGLRRQGILTKGRLEDHASGGQVPFALEIDASNKIVFSFETKDGSKETVVSTSALTANKFYKIAVTRERKTATQTPQGSFQVTTNSVDGDIAEYDVTSLVNDFNASVKEWVEINIYLTDLGPVSTAFSSGEAVINDAERYHPARSNRSGRPSRRREVLREEVTPFSASIQYAGGFRYEGQPPGTTSQKLEIGVVHQNQTPFFFNGAISEIRIWGKSLPMESVGVPLSGKEPGLISWWRFEENRGNVAYDSKSTNHAKRGENSRMTWVNSPDPNASSLNVYVNGMLETTTGVSMAGVNETLTVGACGADRYFQGEIDELRIWKTARTPEQIQDNISRRLLGEKEDLIAYYQFDASDQRHVNDHSGNGNHLLRGGSDTTSDSDPGWIISQAPVSYETPQIRSALAGVETGFHDIGDSTPKVAEYGDVQYNADGTMSGVMKRCYSYVKDGKWQLITGFKIGNLVTEWIGQAQYAPQLVGIIEGAPPVPGENLTASGLILGETADYDAATSVTFKQAKSVDYVYTVGKGDSFDSRLSIGVEAGISQEVDMLIAPLGFGTEATALEVGISAGIGYSFESSNSYLKENTVVTNRESNRDTTLSLSGKWEQVQADRDDYLLPERRYVPANTGMALVRSETADVFALRLMHNNMLVSYRMVPNPDIPKDYNLLTFPMNPKYIKQGTLDGKLGMDGTGVLITDPDYPEASIRGEYSFFKPREAYQLKSRIERIEKELQNAYVNHGRTNRFSLSDTAANELPPIVKQNLANTYVWTADGGLYTESTGVLDAVTETHNVNFVQSTTVGSSLGASFGILGISVGFSMESQMGGSFTKTATKSKNAEVGFSVDVDLGGVESDLHMYFQTQEEAEYYAQFGVTCSDPADPVGKQAFNADGTPFFRPGKVDAYRFMTFYLQPEVRHFEELKNKVVDQKWLLESNHPNARALMELFGSSRTGQSDSEKSIPWRIMHRTTFVSRVLPPIPSTSATHTDAQKALSDARINSNYELIRLFEPFVKPYVAASYVAFIDAAEKALLSYFPELVPAKDDILSLLCAYFEVYDITD